jgi:hypothetical protein
MRKLDTLSDRINYSLEVVGMRQAQLAKLINVKPQVINFLCETNTKNSRFTFEIASVLELNPTWLATGQGAMFLNDDPRYKLFKEYEIVQVLDDSTIKSAFQFEKLPEQKNVMVAPVKTQRENVFGLIIKDVAMSPIFPINSILFFQWDPTYKPKAEDYLVLYSEEYDAVLVRKLVIENDKEILAIINEKFYRPVEFSKKIKIIGTVIATYNTFNGENGNETT